MKFGKELEIAKKAAESAAVIIKEYANQKSYSIQLKGKNDLVTDADVASEKKIIEMLREAFPTDEIFAEESEMHKNLPNGRVWIIDPIDGTTNFAHGFPIYCVSIALWENGLPKVAVIKEVSNGEVFWAIEGEGAFLNEEQIYISKQTDFSQTLIGTGFPYTVFDSIDNYLALLKSLMQNTHGIRRPGAASYDLCCLACGRFDGFFESGLSAWDVAAGALIVQEAGGVVTDWNNGNNWLLGKTIVAGNEAIHTRLLQEINEYF